MEIKKCKWCDREPIEATATRQVNGIIYMLDLRPLAAESQVGQAEAKYERLDLCRDCLTELMLEWMYSCGAIREEA